MLEGTKVLHKGKGQFVLQQETFLSPCPRVRCSRVACSALQRPVPYPRTRVYALPPLDSHPAASGARRSTYFFPPAPPLTFNLPPQLAAPRSSSQAAVSRALPSHAVPRGLLRIAGGSMRFTKERSSLSRRKLRELQPGVSRMHVLAIWGFSWISTVRR
jgi:hypothetical protein